MSASVAEVPVAAGRRGPPSVLMRGLKALASLRLTVVLFALSLLIVLFGTLAQVDDGVWTVVDRYFRSAYVWVPFQLFFPRSIPVAGGFPFFGGWLIGAALLVNLLAAHLVRFRLTWKRSGILVLHAGIVVLLLSELVAGTQQVEARMTIAEGETVNFVELSRKIELAFTDQSNPNYDSVIAIPGSRLINGTTIRDDRLPVDVEVVEFMPNSTLSRPDGRSTDNLITTLNGQTFAVAPARPGSGVGTNQREDAPAARIILRDKATGHPLGSFAVSLWQHPNFTLRDRDLRFAPQSVTVDGKTYRVELRPERVYKPYALKLLEFRHDKYLGTNTPRNFSSQVRLIDPQRRDEHEVTISMNAPLRVYDGDPILRKCDTLYQSSFLQPEHAGVRGTVLQVVRNPGWLMPYIACILVTIGMAFHFGLHLVQFLARRAAK